MSGVVTERVVECKADVATVWKVVTDTERLNRAVGFDKLVLSPLSNETSARYLVTTKLGGMPVEFEERPFEWVYPETYKLKRIMRSGPFLSLEHSYRLQPIAAGGTRLTIRLVVEPRTRLFAPFLRVLNARTLQGFEKAILAMDRQAVARPAVTSMVDESAMARATASLRRGSHPEVVQRLAAYLREADDVDASRIRPFVLADAWSLDRRSVLVTCLEAVRAGLLELRWEVICPSCRTATDALPSLGELGEHGACQLCELEFAVDLDQAVEATFAPAAAIRRVDAGPYCIGGPSRTPHVLAQVIVPARGMAPVPCPHEPGRVRLFVRGGRVASVVVSDDGPFELDLDATAIPADATLTVAPGATLRLANPSERELHAKIERVVYADQAARADFLMTLPAFRREFSTDTLRAGTALKIARVGLFFSDLTGSTQLYSTAGDAAAFRVVLDHFDLVIGLIEKSGGTLVKTIGDAVMAAFADDLAALTASVAILSAFDAFRVESDTRERTNIKLGVFGGPCYAVTANGRLDYFGQTVNIAARLQGEAKSGELVVPASLADAAVAAGRLPAAFVRERYRAALKGVDEPLDAVRIRIG